LALQALEDPDSCALACLDARMGEVYWGCFAWDAACGVRQSGSLRVGLPGSVSLDPSVQYVGVGRGFSAYPVLATLPGVTTDAARSAALPNAREIARLGALRFEAGEALDAADLKPLYVRDRVAFTEAERAAQSSL
jgi:tRNA threonylcarbamoyladenosine biosynthesis protein TsaB